MMSFKALWTRLRSGVPALMLAACLLSAAGCGVSGRELSRQNDELRRAKMELEREVAELREAVRLRESEARALQRQVAGGATAIPDADVPKLAELRFARYSGPIDTTRDGVDDTVRLYLRPTDQHGRFIPATGRAVVQVVAIRPSRPPTTLAEVTFEPDAFNRAYRSGITGTHYSLDVKLSQPAPDDLTGATAKVTFIEAATGVEHTVQTPIAFRRR